MNPFNYPLAPGPLHGPFPVEHAPDEVFVLAFDDDAAVSGETRGDCFYMGPLSELTYALDFDEILPLLPEIGSTVVYGRDLTVMRSCPTCDDVNGLGEVFVEGKPISEMVPCPDCPPRVTEYQIVHFTETADTPLVYLTRKEG